MRTCCWHGPMRMTILRTPRVLHFRLLQTHRELWTEESHTTLNDPGNGLQRLGCIPAQPYLLFGCGTGAPFKGASKNLHNEEPNSLTEINPKTLADIQAYTQSHSKHFQSMCQPVPCDSMCQPVIRDPIGSQWQFLALVAEVPRPSRPSPA